MRLGLSYHKLTENGLGPRCIYAYYAYYAYSNSHYALIVWLGFLLDYRKKQYKEKEASYDETISSI